MHINDLPHEILSTILKQAAVLNAGESVTYTYGLTQAPLPLQKAKLDRYIRGPVTPDALNWDAASSLRHVCSRWHDWALEYSLDQIFLRRWRGSERWAEISLRRETYRIYELIERPSGYAVYRDPFRTLANSDKLFTAYPTLAGKLRRLWFNGFYTTYTDHLILSVLRSCRNLTSISVPWTLLRHGTADEWIHLLGMSSEDDLPLRSLEIQAVCLSEAQEKDYHNAIDDRPLLNPAVDFSQLRRLKFFGNTTFAPICDADLFAIARTATNLEEVHVTNIATVSISGVMALVKASQSTIRVLDYSPRADEGFSHADPGPSPSGEHICETLTHCPKLKDLSISLPAMCSALFSNPDVVWEGECQVRALALCSSTHTTTSKGRDVARKQSQQSKLASLRQVLDASRALTVSQQRQRRALEIELFFADCIFDPRDCVVDGDFACAEISSNGTWPSTRTSSGKGPYGSTGLYGKDEGTWEIVSEEEFLKAVERGWLRL
ncbi:hypothetical protein MBLNU459_g1722t1 [Dothideomycetes sp. NU459]